ncbi:BSD domain-containing protein [Cordyceps javanica]|uniref:BSD domain-containing protein n=1 Tax=Cordyceps javanica TaxID=43265 RepID=A0A545V8Z7_9HYPO|nr:BSD domain-containing protein [Cordyceps javanica]TQW08645.1 BSD domain-containing protein [Cordyceps javanica]
MDLAYDHIQEEAFRRDTPKPGEQRPEQPPASSLNDEIQDAYKAFSASPWGAKIGGFFGNMVKQGESVYNQASKELAEVGEDASKGFADLRETIISRTRGMSINASGDQGARSVVGDEATTTVDGSSTDAETYLSRLRTEAAKRLKDLQRAEDAADEALLRFGGNVRDFLRDAIQVAPPADGADDSAVLFESKDASGKRVIHTSRFDAQLHVIHTSTDSLAKDPAGEEYNKFTSEFDVEKKTADIASDLEKYPELRTTMEKLVPDQISYADFWKRYYFLRRGIEDAESRRKELLKAAAAEDEVGWDDDESEDEAAAPKKPASVESSTTINPKKEGLLKPNEMRKSNDERSQADSEASYDVVGGASGLPSQAASSPKESRKDDDSDDDWE